MTPTIPARLPHLDPVRLRSGVAGADIRVLLMCVFHASGDRRWLEPRYRPKRDVRLISEEASGLDADIQQEIREAAVDLFTRKAGSAAAIGDPGDELMLEMMRICMSENIAAGYAPMMREEMGLIDRDTPWSAEPPAERLAASHLLIVGAGASGIILGARLKRLGIPFTILERHDEVGGTWLENRYPGCGVDTPNHAYSFSIGKRYRWSSYFSPRDDIWKYLQGAADEFGVREHIRFGTTVAGASWNEAQGLWQVTVQNTAAADQRPTRSVIEAPILVSAIGQFGLPNKPHINGDDQFAGISFHTSSWPEELDLTAKRVAIIGTGASAMQIVPGN